VTDEAVFVTGGQRFLLDGSLRQDLSRLDGDAAAFRGRGVVTLPFLVDSADQQLFRVRGRLQLDQVSASLPGSDLAIEEASGAASLEEAITFDPQSGLALVPSTDQRVFARARYQDLQPFLASDALITAKRVRFGDVELAPVVTSLEVQRNRFSLNKLKAQRGAALLSGQVFLDYQPGNRAVTFRGAVTGLTREGATVPLDANAAVSFSLDRLEVDGRVQVVRTSREHVLDLLDVLDPHKEVASLNRLRMALGWGYPRQLRLDFHDGLLAMDVELGGLGALFDLGTLRGIALGPFITRYLAPHLAFVDTP
jgi:translocation and assembly module TamB